MESNQPDGSQSAIFSQFSTTRIQNSWISKIISISFILFPGICFFSPSLYAVNLVQHIDQLVNTRYEHWNAGENKITGQTAYSYETTTVDGESYFVETGKNIDGQGTIYGEKKIWFSSDTGEFIKSADEDFRTKTSVTNEMMGEVLVTQLKSHDETRRLEIDNESHLIPFEIVWLGLQDLVPEVISRNEAKFVLYVPLLALELEKNHLPQSLSTFKMMATLEERKRQDTLFGSKETITILVQPNSLFLRKILPKDKSEFRFTYLAEPPYYLLKFKDEIGELRLAEIKTKNQ